MVRKHGKNRREKSVSSSSVKKTADFWGCVDTLPPVEKVTTTTDSYAVVKSLGRPPFSGHEAVSEHYLRAVYQNTVKLAEVLAIAGDISADVSNESAYA